MTSSKSMNYTALDKKKRRYRRGYIQFSDVVHILNLGDGVFRRYMRNGIIPQPERCPECNYYTVEQLECLIQAKIHASIDRDTYIIFSLKMFKEYIQEHWPLGEEEKLVLEGAKEKRWRRKYDGKDKAD